MNDSERKALVDELADGLRDKLGPWDSLEFETWEGIAGACLPVIERLLAAADAPGLDELLDSVHPGAGVEVEPSERGDWKASVDSPEWGYRVYEYGPTRMDAIRNAVAQATATQEGGEGG